MPRTAYELMDLYPPKLEQPVRLCLMFSCIVYHEDKLNRTNLSYCPFGEQLGKNNEWRAGERLFLRLVEKPALT